MKKNKKILILVNYLKFFYYLIVYLLPNALLADGFDVFIGYGELRGADPKILEEKGFKVEFCSNTTRRYSIYFKDLKTLF